MNTVEIALLYSSFTSKKLSIMFHYKNPFEPGGKFYNPRITDASKVTEPRIMPRWAEESNQQQNIKGTKFYDINTGELIEQIPDGNTQIISIEKETYLNCKSEYSLNAITHKVYIPIYLDDSSAFSYFISTYCKMKYKNIHVLPGLTTEELNVRAFLSTIRYAENSGPGQTEPLGYNALYGGGTFTDETYEECPSCYAKHPNKAITKWGITSTAAGAYQFLGGQNWDSLNLPDFSPLSQDKGALILIHRQEKYNPKAKGVIEDIKNENIISAAKKLNRTWTSLPGGDQEGLNENEFLNKFKECLINELKENSILYSPIGTLKL